MPIQDLTTGPALLFCPGDRPERFEKALARADAVIVDLEDAVAPERRPHARGALIDAELDPSRVAVRVSPVGTADFAADLATLSQTDIRTIVLAKASGPRTIGAIDPRFHVIAQCETAKGISQAHRIAALENVHGLLWGAEDLVAGIGGASSRTPDGRYRDVVRHARSRVLLEAAARGKPAIDAVYPDVADLDGQRREAEDAAASGFLASACAHPDQAAVIRAAYRPADEPLAWAWRVLEAARSNRGAFSFEGRMVDEPVLRQARILLARAGAR